MANDGRYRRQTALPEIGATGQERLEKAVIGIVGCGALGGACANTLARAGVGKLVLVDDDRVAVENLHRQVLFDEADAANRSPKVVAAAEKLRRANSAVAVTTVPEKLTGENAVAVLAKADIIVDGSDNLATRFLINEACISLKKPWIYGGVYATEGMTMSVIPGKTPCFRCFMDAAGGGPSDFSPQTGSGILSTAVAVVAALQATEVVKVICGTEPRRHLVHVDVWRGTWTPVVIPRSATCPACAKQTFEFLAAGVDPGRRHREKTRRGAGNGTE
jgi:adenylyltransferase/sulfurtransferase